MRKIIVSATIEPTLLGQLDLLAQKYGKSRSAMLEIAMKRLVESDSRFNNLLKPVK
jgi:metal-responsive CopG/Arc/MetJ family transcriptional regulator